MSIMIRQKESNHPSHSNPTSKFIPWVNQFSFFFLIFYFPEPRQSDVGLFIEDIRGLYIKADHPVIPTQDNTSYTMMRTFLPQNSKSFSMKEIQDIKAIYLKAIYKTAEKVFHLDESNEK